MSCDLPASEMPDRSEGDEALLARLDLLVVGRRKLGLEAMQALLPKPLVLEMMWWRAGVDSAMIFARSEGYQSLWVWDVSTPTGVYSDRPRGLNPDMAFAKPALDRFFQLLAEAIAEHDAQGWEDNAVRDRRRALALYRELLSDF
ncbi:MAG TPA: hypothetical protein PKA13_16875 [Geminicoccaceae bacterium]|nr:hypothetical protein [Geminicoccus sp.]HMU51451.1 hypothetical protein [Geminicoccaceae bacterium]